MEAQLENGAVTLGSAKAEARRLVGNGEFGRALFIYDQLLAAFPVEDELRLDVARLLARAGHSELAAQLHETLAVHFANAGRPLRALIGARALVDLGRDPAPIVELVAEAYAAGSARLAAFAARPAPFDPRLQVTLRPAPADPELEPLVRTVVARVNDLSGHPAYPPRLHPIPFLSELTAQSLRAVVAELVLHRLSDGQPAMRQGDPGTSFFLLAGGELRVSVSTADGGDRELARLHEHSLFGEMALITRQPRVASVRAVGEADVLEVSREALDRVKDQIPAVQQALDRFARERLIRNLLATSPLFTPFTKDQQADLLRRFEGVEVDPGAEIIRQGDRGQGLYVVLSGELEVTARAAGDQAGPLRLAALGAGDIFGEMSLVTSQPTMATVRALSSCNLLFLARHYVERLAAAVPEVSGYFAKVAARRAEDNTLRLGAAAVPLEPVDVDVSDALLL